MKIFTQSLIQFFDLVINGQNVGPRYSSHHSPLMPLTVVICEQRAEI